MPMQTDGKHAREREIHAVGLIDLMTRVFDDEVTERLFYAMSHSKTMRNYVGAISRAVKQNGG